MSHLQSSLELHHNGQHREIRRRKDLRLQCPGVLLAGLGSPVPTPRHFFHVLDKKEKKKTKLLYRIIWESREALGLKPLDLHILSLMSPKEKNPR